jgi:hypothetical protein
MAVGELFGAVWNVELSGGPFADAAHADCVEVGVIGEQCAAIGSEFFEHLGCCATLILRMAATLCVPMDWSGLVRHREDDVGRRQGATAASAAGAVVKNTDFTNSR